MHNLYDMFYIRKTLHQRAYQHKTGKSVEFMYASHSVYVMQFNLMLHAVCGIVWFALPADRLRDILVQANEHVTFPDHEGYVSFQAEQSLNSELQYFITLSLHYSASL